MWAALRLNGFQGEKGLSEWLIFYGDILAGIGLHACWQRLWRRPGAVMRRVAAK